MSHTEFIVIAEKDDVLITVEKSVGVDVRSMIRPDLKVILAGNVGPRGVQGDTGVAGPIGPEGPQGQWTALTQAQYDALSPPDPDTLYVIVT